MTNDQIVTTAAKGIANTRKRYLDGCMSHNSYKSHVESLIGRARHLGLEHHVAFVLREQYGYERF